MIEPLLLLTGVCIVISMCIAYSQFRDALHPLMFLGPMLGYMFVVRPAILVFGGTLQEFVTDEQMLFAQVLFTAGIGLFCGGVLFGSRGRRGRVRFEVTPGMRSRLVSLAVLLGVLSLCSYWLGIFLSGGFFRVYGNAKGFYSAGSGWINELVNLSIPSAALLLLAWQGDRRYRHYIGWAIFFASPLLIHGLLGARRGPTFIILASMVVAWYITSGKRISLWKVITRFGVIGLLTLFLFANRAEIYIGSDADFSIAKLVDGAVPTEVDEGDDIVFLYGFVNGARETETYYWGRRYVVTFLVRPIPRQLWPTKYADCGLGWMVTQYNVAGITDEEWNEVLGWQPQRGSAAGFVADLFLEFSWGGLVGCFGLGWFFGAVWRQAVRRAGFWTLLYIQTAALSVYVPSQSVSAVLDRFLVMTVPTFLMWKFYIGRTNSRQAQCKSVLISPVNSVAGRVG